MDQERNEEDLLMNILKAADEIINNRSEEKERQYGPIGEGLERAPPSPSGHQNFQVRSRP